jgi:hypothetical protein
MPASLVDALEEAHREAGCCQACRFWHRRYNAGQTKAECRRWPPQTVSGRTTPPPNAHPNWQPRPEHYFPMTMLDQWCGEFQPREGSDA